MAVTRKIKSRRMIAVVEVPGVDGKVKNVDRSISGVSSRVNDTTVFNVTTELFKLQSATVVEIDDVIRTKFAEE